MNKTISDDPLWALYYENDAFTVSGERIMGRQAAGNSMLRAYAKSNYNPIGAYASDKGSFNLNLLIPSSVFKSDFDATFPRRISILGLNSFICNLVIGKQTFISLLLGVLLPGGLQKIIFVI